MASVSPMVSGSPQNSLAPTDTVVTHHTNTSDYLGHTFHGVVGSVELWLGAQALIFNILVIIYYRAMFQRVIPMMYLMIAACDTITGVAAVLTGTLILSVRNHVELATDLSYAAYFVYSVTIPTSIFLNVNLAVIRTINLHRPLYQISKGVVSGVVGLVAVGWIIFTGWHLTRWDRHRNLLHSYIYSPGQFQTAYHQGTTRQMECTNTVLFVTVPYLLPSAVVLVCMAVQLQLNYKILQHVINVPTWRRKESGDTEQHKDSQNSERWRQQRHVTITILCLTLLFFVCNTVFLYLPLSYCLNLDVVIMELEEGRRKDRLRHITGVVFPFINAAFSPVILVIRGGILDWACSRRKQEEEQVKKLDTVLSNNTTLDNIVSTNC